MNEYLLEVKLPYQKPQNILIRRMINGVYRLALLDRFDRVEHLNGEDIGFGILVFSTCRYPRIVRLVMKSDFSEAIFRNFEGQSVAVEIKLL